MQLMKCTAFCVECKPGFTELQNVVVYIYDKIFHKSTMLYTLFSKQYIALFPFKKLCGMAY